MFFEAIKYSFNNVLGNVLAKYFENLYDFNVDDADVLPNVDYAIFKNDFIFEECFTVYETEQAIKLLKLRKHLVTI